MRSGKRASSTTAAEIRAAIKVARVREKSATKITATSYDRRADAVSCRLSTGALLEVPRKLVPGFAKAHPSRLADLAIAPGGESVWSDNLDDGALLEQLLVLAAGEKTLGTLGARINASKRSAARAAASRANGAKGGRPRKSAA